MNTRGNKRGKESEKIIEQAFFDLITANEFEKISVQAICNHANINRTTFYAHYLDIYDLLEKTENKVSNELKAIILECKSNQDIHQFLCEVFRFVKQYQNFYKACFSGHISISALNLLSMKPFIDTIDEYSKRLNFYSTHEINYHISFFTAGIGEVIKIWLYNGCMESPEEMANVIYEEYRVKF